MKSQEKTLTKSKYSIRTLVFSIDRPVIKISHLK